MKNSLKSFSTLGLILGILGIFLGGIVFSISLFAILSLAGTGSSPFGIIILYGIVGIFISISPMIAGFVSLISAIMSKLALKRKSLGLLLGVTVLNLVYTALLVGFFIGINTYMSSGMAILALILTAILESAPFCILSMIYIVITLRTRKTFLQKEC